MPQISVRFETENKTNLEQTAQDLQQRLKQLAPIEDARARVDTKRMVTGLEIAGAISVGITIVSNAAQLTSKTREFVTELRKLIPELKKLAETMGFTKATLTVDDQPVKIEDVEKLSDAELEQAETSESAA